VVSTVRDRDLNLNLNKNLKAQRYPGKVVLTARHEEEAQDFLAAGADIVLRPFFDAAEQAADSLTTALQVFTEGSDWPGTLGIFRLEAGTVFSGRTIEEIPLRRETGVTIIAVTRAGKTFFDPDPHLPLYPGDRLVLLGEPEGLARAEVFLALRQITAEDAEEERFSLAEIPLAADSPLVGKSLAEAKFRENYGVSVIGILRDGRHLTAPAGKDIFQAGDSLIVAGQSNIVQKLQSRAPL
jgi:K+/H+ antiporter YhaU regulatory subunit KhtT